MSATVLFAVLALVPHGYAEKLEIAEDGTIVLDNEPTTKFSGLLIASDGTVVMKIEYAVFGDGFESGDMSKWSFGGKL